jgi:uncharacterized protein YuzE
MRLPLGIWIMKLHYCPETDSLYMDLSEKTSVNSHGVAPGIVLDFDVNGSVAGIDVHRAGNVVNLSSVEATNRPASRMSHATEQQTRRRRSHQTDDATLARSETEHRRGRTW